MSQSSVGGFQQWIEAVWYGKKPAGHWLIFLLFPINILYFLIVSFRRLIALRATASDDLPCPVIVVGNISIGGNGKTPFVIWLVEQLKAKGYHPGVISRGYGGKSEHYPLSVSSSMAATQTGDEPLLIARRLGCPVVVGPNRIADSQQLIAEFGCDVIISDDGLQHYKLPRDIELVIVDGQRRFGNQWLLPIGPLREPVNRLQSVDFAIVNGNPTEPYHYLLQPGLFYPVKQGNTTSASHQGLTAEALKQRFGDVFVAASGIGNPERFYQTLATTGLQLSTQQSFVDHHKFTASDFSFVGDLPLIMTEKDAVKCASFAADNWFYLAVDAIPCETLATELLQLVDDVAQEKASDNSLSTSTGK